MKTIANIASALSVTTAQVIDQRAKALAADGRDIISFCIGEPDFPTPPHILSSGMHAMEAGKTKYTAASGALPLRAAVAAALERDIGVVYAPQEVAITTGAKYAVYAALLAVVDPGDEVILPAPYWTSYHAILRLIGAIPVIVRCGEESGYKLTQNALSQAASARTKAVILNNPNNPTGAVYTRPELSALAAVCRAFDLYVIADEIYGRLVYGGAPFCAAASIDTDMRARTVTIGGVSKTYAMTGWRIGYAAGNETVIRAISAILSHTTGSPNAMAQAAAQDALLGSQECVEQMSRVFMRRRDRLIDALALIPNVRFPVPDGAFYALLDVRNAIQSGGFEDETDFALRLLDAEGVATVPCGDFGAPGCIRLSYTLDEERILEGAQRLARFIERNG